MTMTEKQDTKSVLFDLAKTWNDIKWNLPVTVRGLDSLTIFLPEARVIPMVITTIAFINNMLKSEITLEIDDTLTIKPFYVIEYQTGKQRLK